MAIKRIEAKNFKSFKKLGVNLGDLNILIGANASGKSNFVDIFRFLRDIKSSGLENAISLQGGVEYLRNLNVGSSEELSLEVVFDHVFGINTIRIHETIYKFAIKFEDTGSGFKVVEDRLTQKFSMSGLRKEITGSGEIIFSNVDGKIGVTLGKHSESAIGLDGIISSFFVPENLPHGAFLLLEASFPYILQTPLNNMGNGIPIYDFDSRFAKASFPDILQILQIPLDSMDNGIPIYDFESRIVKNSIPKRVKAELEENGSNLAVVVKNIMESEDGKRKLLNLVTYLLDFVVDLQVEQRMDKSFLLKLRERYSEKYLPVDLISDGTIDMIALTVALYFGKESLAIIEEPDRGVHPHLISRAVHMMEDASSNKQIIVTTHSPEVVKYANLDNLLLISRDKDGFSSITPRPAEKETVKIFLENEIGIEELYADSLLEM